MITITIKGIPKETHRELKKRAAANRRSLNNEVISVLESSVINVPVGFIHLPQLQRSVRYFEHASKSAIPKKIAKRK